MRVRFTPRALAEAKRSQTWWRDNRPGAADMFERELDGVLERLGAAPDMGSPYRSDDFRVLVRRVLMPKTGNHVYYALDGDDVVVLSIWGARRGHGPGL